MSSVFTGRVEIGRELREGCLPTEPIHLQSVQKRFVVYGLGGSGKTQVCLKFAQDHREKYGIFLPLSASCLLYQSVLLISSLPRNSHIFVMMFHSRLTMLPPWNTPITFIDVSDVVVAAYSSIIRDAISIAYLYLASTVV